MSSIESRRRITVACAVQFIGTFSYNFSMAFMTLFIYSELGVNSLPEAALWAGTAHLLSNSILALTSPVWGWLTEKIGGKTMLIRVMLGNAVILLLMSFSSSVYHVIVLRLIEGVVTGTGTVVMVIIASSVDEEHLSQVIGYQQSLLTAGSLLGPAVGGVMAPILGFRSCFLISGMMIMAAIPFVLWARFEERIKSKKSSERFKWKDFKGIGRDFVALLVVQAAFNFITPILPTYLSEAGMTGNLLVQYTGAILVVSGVAYAVSVSVTTRIFARKTVPILLAGASAAIFIQGLFREALGFTALRIAQCFFYSAAPSRLLGDAGARNSNRGLTLGILNSARTMGNALGPFLASSTAYATNLTTAFMVIASVSMLGAIATIRRGNPSSNRTSDD